MSLAEFFAGLEEKHAVQVERGEHDEHCEFGWTVARDHAWTRLYLCHCSKRRREAAGYTRPPGRLLRVRSGFPTCPRCSATPRFDGDCWICDPCRVSWDVNGTGAEFTDEFGDLGERVAEPAVR